MLELSKKLYDDVKTVLKSIGTFFKDLFYFIIKFFKEYPLYLNILMIFIMIESLFGILILNTPKRGEYYSLYARFVDLAIILAIFGLIDLIPKARVKHIVGYILSFFIFLILLADFGYYDAFGTLSSVKDLKSLVWITSQDVGVSILWNQVVLTIVFGAYSFAYIKYIIVNDYFVEKRHRVNQYKMSISFVAVMLLTPFTTRLYFLDEDFDVNDQFYLIDYISSDSYLYENIPSRTSFAKKFGYINYRLKDLSTLWNTIDQEETIQKLDNYFETTEEKPTNEKSGIFSDKNLVTIRLESFDTRLIDPEITPNLYEIYNNSTTFSNYFLPAYQTGATCNTEFLSQTGIFPPLVGSYDKNICTSFSTTYYEYSLARQFTRSGYETYYLHQGQRSYYNRDYILTHGYGFNPDNIHFSMTDLDNNRNSPYDTDMAEFFDDVNWNEAFYVDIMTYSGHAGSYEYFIDSNGVGITADNAYQSDRIYSNPVDYSFITQTNPGLFYEKKGTLSSYNNYMSSYLTKMYETDLFIGLLLDEIEAAGELEDTVFIFTPDHWPYMFEENTSTADAGADAYLETLANEQYDLLNTHEIFTSENDVYKQTFIIYDPSETLEPENHKEVVSSIDIYKTILNLFDDGTGTFTYKYGFGDDMFQLVEEKRNSIPIFEDLSTYYNGHYIDFMSNADYSTIIGYNHLVELWNEKMSHVSMSLGIVLSDYFKPNA